VVFRQHLMYTPQQSSATCTVLQTAGRNVCQVRWLLCSSSGKAGSISLCRGSGSINVCCCVHSQGPELIGTARLPGTQFSTTDTFTRTHGFVITAAAPAELSSFFTGQQHEAAGSHSSKGVHGAEQQPQQPSTPGWSGLLEISRSGGACAESAMTDT